MPDSKFKSRRKKSEASIGVAEIFTRLAFAIAADHIKKKYTAPAPTPVETIDIPYEDVTEQKRIEKC